MPNEVAMTIESRRAAVSGAAVRSEQCTTIVAYQYPDGRLQSQWRRSLGSGRHDQRRWCGPLLLYCRMDVQFRGAVHFLRAQRLLPTNTHDGRPQLSIAVRVSYQ
jgi:hypothetical protein